MNEIVGQVFNIAKENTPVPGCTISKQVTTGENAISYFSLAKNTDISAEIYPYHKFILLQDGEMEVYTSNETVKVRKDECILTKTDIPVGMRTNTYAIYTEINIRRNSEMNEAIKAGEVFKLGDLLPYQDGKIVNMDVAHNDKMKFVVMSFGAGTALSEHAAPGEAIIFALDGEGIITYEGKEHTIKAGENFHFAKGGMHAVKAVTNFKMALLLTLE